MTTPPHPGHTEGKFRQAAKAATGAVGSIRDAYNQHKDQIREGVAKRVKEGIDTARSDEGRVTIQRGVTSAVRDRLGGFIQSARRKGNFAALAMAHMARSVLTHHVSELGIEQRLFRNMNKARRGDVHKMTHQDLRDARDYAKSHGGPHAQEIQNQAHGELHRREEARTGIKRQIRQAEIRQDEDIRTNKIAARHRQTMGHLQETHTAKEEHAKRIKKIGVPRATHNGPVTHIHFGADPETIRRHKEARDAAAHGRSVPSAKPSNQRPQGARPLAVTSKSRAALAKDVTILKRTAKGATVRTASGKTEWLSREKLGAAGRAKNKARRVVGRR